MKKVASIFGIALLSGAMTLGGYKLFFETPPVIIERTEEPSAMPTQTRFLSSTSEDSSPTSFTLAAEKTVHAVVHVKNTAVRTQTNPYADFFFGSRSRGRKYEQIGTGSGVIISEDGYIVTNNHVIDNATDIEITLNDRKKYKAELVGTDAANDIALLKITADKKFPYIPFGNSNSVKIGEWVLAVGNPYNLTSTVTAGIISAKARDLSGSGNVESFLQTDAAVNPGNSGGALVNTRGELIGINTAISSKTGSFVGYSFAVPSNIAKKIIEDIMEFGSVQEALIGFNPVDDDQIEGVKIGAVSENSGASKAGLKAGDVIVKINDVSISKFSELRGQLTAKRPGEKVNVTIKRDDELLTKLVTLSKRDSYITGVFGAELKDLSKKEKAKFGLKGGAKITRTSASSILSYYGVEAGYVITSINKKTISNASEAAKLLDASYGKSQAVYMEVMNLDGEIERYVFR